MSRGAPLAVAGLQDCEDGPCQHHALPGEAGKECPFLPAGTNERDGAVEGGLGLGTIRA